MEENLISVIIPTYNRPDILCRTLDSYISSDVSELIIIDDGSRVSYDKLIEKLKNLTINFKYIKNKKNLGLPLARNIGIENVSKNSKFIFFGEDDVFLLKDTIKLMYETLFKENADIIGCNVKYLHDNDYIKYVDNKKVIINKIKTYEEIFKMKSIHLGKKEIYEHIEFDPRYIINSYREETDFFLTTMKRGHNIVFIQNYIAFNLPREECNYGGEWEINPLIYEFSTIYNNIFFHLKHFKFITKQTSVLKILIEIIKFSYNRIKIMFIKLKKKQ